MKLSRNQWLSGVALCFAPMALGCGRGAPSQSATTVPAVAPKAYGRHTLDQATLSMRLQQFSDIPPLGPASPEFEAFMGSNQEGVTRFIKKFEQSSGGVTPNTMTVEFVSAQLWPRCRRLALNRYQQTDATQATLDAFMQDLEYYMPVVEEMIWVSQTLGTK